MIFEIHSSDIEDFKNNIYFVETSSTYCEAEELFELLRDTYPNDNSIHLCCFGGYDNSVCFVRN